MWVVGHCLSTNILVSDLVYRLISVWSWGGVCPSLRVPMLANFHARKSINTFTVIQIFGKVRCLNSTAILTRQRYQGTCRNKMKYSRGSFYTIIDHVIHHSSDINWLLWTNLWKRLGISTIHNDWKYPLFLLFAISSAKMLKTGMPLFSFVFSSTIKWLMTLVIILRGLSVWYSFPISQSKWADHYLFQR